MLVAKKIYKNETNEIVRLSCEYELNGVRKKLWFETDICNRSFIDENNGDSFFIILFLIAIENNVDITFETPVSRRLFYGVESLFMEFLVKANPNLKRIKIHAPINEKAYPAAWGIATAMSLGLDSFFTLAKNVTSKYPITHLTLFNAGTFGTNSEKGNEIFYSMQKQVKAVAKGLNYPLLWVDTNLNDHLKINFLKSHTFRHLACSLLFPNLLKTYFYSSGHKLDDFSINLSDSANYDLFNSMVFSTNSLEFQVFGMVNSRVEKTLELSEFEPSTRFMNVCLITNDYKNIKENNGLFVNCSKCYKCIRTMMTLDVIGKLDMYSDIFDIDYYENNKAEFFANVYYHYIRSKNVFSVEILKEIKNQDYKIPIKVLPYIVIRIFQPIKNKFKLVFNRDLK